MKLPDVGEGVAEAELVEWLVAVGDTVTPDTVIAEVLTDKATVEVSAPVDGEVVALHGEPGDVLAVGSDLIGIETSADPDEIEALIDDEADAAAPAVVPDDDDDDGGGGDPTEEMEQPVASSDTVSADQVTAAPAVRARASSLDLDLATIDGTGPDGRITHADLDRRLTQSSRRASARLAHTSATRTLDSAPDESHSTPVRGVRRRIAERLSTAWSEIPHITYVDDVDVTELERLRATLNDDADDTRLTILPFLARALVIALHEQPAINAHYDGESETLTTFDAVHLGIATQTDDGLRVPVVRHAEGRDVWDLATQIGRVSSAARDGSATRDELTGSTITITSLGALGGIATTPIINPPEVSIIGVNKMETRPVWLNGSFQPRQVFNLSSSFDHRMVDGWDAATFVQRIKALLETPALLFVG